MKFRTASNAEDLDMIDELSSFDTVGGVTDRGGFWGIEPQYRDADFFIYMVGDDSEVKELTKLLNYFGYRAYLQFDSEVIATRPF